MSYKVREIEAIRELVIAIERKLDGLFDISLYNRNIIGLEDVRIKLDEFHLELNNIKYKKGK